MSDRPIVLITGASRGIGAATATEFAKRGYDVAITARTESGLQKTAEQVEAAGGQSLLIPADLSDMDVVQSLVPQVLERFGRIDVLVNNAAWREIVSMRNVTLESWEKTIRVCVTAPAFLAKAAAADMETRRKGVIINISSIQSRLAAGICAAYVPSKGAMDAMTYELAATYGPSNIRVVALNPGAIDTEMSNDYADADGDNISDRFKKFCDDLTPLRRAGQPDEIAKSICMLASDDASYLTGTTVTIDGGITQQLSPYSIKHLICPEEYQ